MKFKEPLPAAEQEELVIRAKVDPEAREKVILHNLKLVYYFAKMYYFTNERTEIDDLFQTGIFGLMKAIEKHDPEKGKFSTYASIWIKQSIFRGMFQLTEDISLNELVKGSDDISLQDTIPDTAPKVEDMIESKILNEKLRNLMHETLTEEEKRILCLKYGFYDKEYTFKEIAKKINISNWSANTRHHRAMRTLRKSKYIKELEREMIIDDKTSFYKSPDYTQQRSKNLRPGSYVEYLVLLRDDLAKELDKEREERMNSW